ncbi:DUF1007 family protein [Pragia fontium]|uniref:DUF1007 family protein n=1 Tax=Pragia fontium TaxID=82985 RepID=UPI00064A5E96|nr:DUF1007 family protein [Pragia fontium]AKJ42992.1 hypothetical protein QQ39_13710 [Pragia fontium]VEJ56312.1 ABC-type uncharacterized transport system, periplasmic component [Pragia fontium]
MTLTCRTILIVMCLISPLAGAHPHSFIDLDASLVIENKSLTGIKMIWEMDELTSAELLLDASMAKDNPNVWQSMADELIENTRNQLYFTEVRANGRLVEFAEKTNNYSLHRHGNKAVLTFVLPMAKPIPLAKNAVVISTYEQSYYVDMRYPSEKSIHLPTNVAEICSIKLNTPKPSSSLLDYARSLDKNNSPGEDMMLGSKFAQTITLTCQ